MLTSLFTGAVISLETAKAAVQNGFTEYVGSSVAYGTFRELGPLLTAVVFAGRAGAAIAASLGAMKVTEQIEAFQSMGVSPVKVLVTPRLIACIFTVPLLTVFADIIGISAGYYMAHWVAGIPQYTYFHSVQQGTDSSDFYNGLVKAAVFGVIVAHHRLLRRLPRRRRRRWCGAGHDECGGHRRDPYLCVQLRAVVRALPMMDLR